MRPVQAARQAGADVQIGRTHPFQHKDEQQDTRRHRQRDRRGRGPGADRGAAERAAARHPSASPGGPPQQIYIGTPPDPTCLGTVFQRLHDEAHGDGGCDDSWWLEWAAGELPSEDARAEDLLDLAYATNPALGTRITERAVRNEIRTMTRDGFARERLGWWKPGGSIERAIPFEKWKECEISVDEAPEGVPSFGVKFSADGRHVALSAAIVKPDGGSFVELVSYASTSGGIGWLVDFVVERADSCGSVAVDGRSGSSAFLDSAVKRGFPKRFATECSTANAIAAASMLLEEVESKTLEHIESPALDESATGSIRRKWELLAGSASGTAPIPLPRRSNRRPSRYGLPEPPSATLRGCRRYGERNRTGEVGHGAACAR